MSVSIIIDQYYSFHLHLHIHFRLVRTWHLKKNSAGVSWARTFTSLVYLIHASIVYCSSGCLLVYFSLYVLYELLVCVSVFCVLFLSFNITFDYHSNLINFSWLLLENIVVFLFCLTPAEVYKLADFYPQCNMQGLHWIRLSFISLNCQSNLGKV